MRNTISNRRKQRERGSAIVEFSLVLLPLLAMLFLTLDLAWMLFSWACVQEGVREGVRYAITGHKDADIIAVVQTYSFGVARNVGTSTPIKVYYYSASNPSQTIAATGTSCAGNIVKVVATGVSLTPLAPLWRSKSPISLSGAAADLVEANSSCR